MATLIFSAIGTVIGGPLGGAIGALVGRQVDTAILGSPSREGPRLKELAVTTSSYGAAIPRYFGRMRAAGSIIWSTPLVEHKQTQGGGKGRPSVSSYTYSASFAVALSSRTILNVGRIWADGNLLRGAAGDLKTGGKFRLYTGHGDQPLDPLLAAAETPERCPAYRGLAYCVFEDLELADYGNRIPALTFEIFADSDAIGLEDVVGGVLDNVDASMSLDHIQGLSCEGPLADFLDLISPVFPLDCDVAGDRLSLVSAQGDAALQLRAATVVAADDGFGAENGYSSKRLSGGNNTPEILRYYDVGRDYQPGAQRAVGPLRQGQPSVIELPAALSAAGAANLINHAVRRSRWSRHAVSWRTAEIDPGIRPGALVRIPDQPGLWRVNDWEWRAGGVELNLWRVPGPASNVEAGLPADPGRPLTAADVVVGTTAIAAFELPWDGSGTGDSPNVFAAASSAGAGWAGAALFVDQGDAQLVPLVTTGRKRSVLGHVANPLPGASPLLFDRANSITVELLSDEMQLSDASVRQLAMGANRALLGSELIQYTRAVPIGERAWRLEGLLRGRGGTEAAIATHLPGELFCLLDDTLSVLDGTVIGQNPVATVVALGRGDAEPVVTPITCRGLSLSPPFPVHPRRQDNSDGTVTLRWTRRSRGAWNWPDAVELPLNEQTESYQIVAGTTEAPVAQWNTSVPEITITAAQFSDLRAATPGIQVSVRQRGTYAMSQSLLLTIVD